MSVTVFIALGSNLQNPIQQIEFAIQAISQLSKTQLVKTSSFYRTSAVGFIEQEDFINAVVQVETSLTPTELITALLQIEQQQGRIRDQRWGPRIIDCDIILYGDEKIQLPNLTVPHPEMHNRLFVLVPLAELKVDEVINARIAELTAQTDQRLEQI